MHRFLVQIAVCWTVHRLMLELRVMELNIVLLAGLPKIEYVYTDVHTVTPSLSDCLKCEMHRFLVQVAVC